MATNYSFMNQSSTFGDGSRAGNSVGAATPQTQAQQQVGQNAHQANTAQIADPAPQSAPHTPGPRGNVPAMVPQGYGFQPQDYNPSGYNMGGYGTNPMLTGQQAPIGQGGPNIDPQAAPKSGGQQSGLGLGMQPFPQMTNDLNFWQNRNNQQGTATWMSTLPFWQANFDANANTRDFNEDTRRWDINTGWTQGMDRANLGLQQQDRDLNRDAFNEGVRQFDSTLPISWQDSNTRMFDAQTGRIIGEGTLANNAYGNETDRMNVNFNNQNTQFANQTDRMNVNFNNQNTQFANQTERMLGMDRNSIDRLSVQNDFQIQLQQNRIQEMLANGTISNQQAQQEFQRLELDRRNNWENTANAIRMQDVVGGQQFDYAQLSQQGTQFDANLAYQYAALQAQQQQANAQAYGRFATPNVSRTRRNF